MLVRTTAPLPSSGATLSALALVHFSNGASQPALARYTSDLLSTTGVTTAGFGLVLTGQAIGLQGGVSVAPRLAHRSLRVLLAVGYWGFLPVAGLLSASPIGFFLSLLGSRIRGIADGGIGVVAERLGMQPAFALLIGVGITIAGLAVTAMGTAEPSGVHARAALATGRIALPLSASSDR